ncbi:unnamed protein product [Urochloa humidicola]
MVRIERSTASSCPHASHPQTREREEYSTAPCWWPRGSRSSALVATGKQGLRAGGGCCGLRSPVAGAAGELGALSSGRRGAPAARALPLSGHEQDLGTGQNERSGAPPARFAGAPAISVESPKTTTPSPPARPPRHQAEAAAAPSPERHGPRSASRIGHACVQFAGRGACGRRRDSICPTGLDPPGRRPLYCLHRAAAWLPAAGGGCGFRRRAWLPAGGGSGFQRQAAASDRQQQLEAGGRVRKRGPRRSLYGQAAAPTRGGPGDVGGQRARGSAAVAGPGGGASTSTRPPRLRNLCHLLPGPSAGAAELLRSPQGLGHAVRRERNHAGAGARGVGPTGSRR